MKIACYTMMLLFLAALPQRGQALVSGAVPVMPPPEQHWQQIDWQSHPNRLAIKDQSHIVLSLLTPKPKSVGLSIILSDSLQTLPLQRMANQLNQYGLDIALIIPLTQLDPNQTSSAQASFSKQIPLAQLMKVVQQQFPKAGSKRLIMALGTQVLPLASLLERKQLTEPDALVLIDAYDADPKKQTLMSQDLAKLKTPILDFCLTPQHSIVTSAWRARADTYSKEEKTNIRQIRGLQVETLAKPIYGWLTHEGWF